MPSCPEGGVKRAPRVELLGRAKGAPRAKREVPSCPEGGAKGARKVERAGSD